MVRTSKKLHTFGQWVVTSYGLENTRTPYAIEKARLWEPDWIQHIRGKKPEWDVQSFAEALRKARSVHTPSLSPRREKVRFQSHNLE